MGNCCSLDLDAVAQAIKQNKIDDLKTLLQGASRDDLAQTGVNGSNIVMVACNQSSSSNLLSRSALASSQTKKAAMMKLILDKVVEVGGKPLLAAQLTATDKYHKQHSLMVLCSNSSSSQVIKLILDASVEVIGPELVQSQLSATDSNGMTSLMFLCKDHTSSSSVEKMTLLLNTVVEVGGPQFLKAQLEAKNQEGLNCLLMLCKNESQLVNEKMKIMLDKIAEVGGSSLVKQQIAATDASGHNCLWFLCKPPSPEKFNLIWEKAAGVGKPEMLKQILTATGPPYNMTLLMQLCMESTTARSFEMLKLILHMHLDVGGPEFLHKQLATTNDVRATCFEYACMQVSMHPLNTSAVEVMKVIASLVHHFNKETFEQQYAKMQVAFRQALDASWSPDSAPSHEAKEILVRMRAQEKAKKDDEVVVSVKKSPDDHLLLFEDDHSDANSNNNNDNNSTAVRNNTASKQEMQEETPKKKKKDVQPHDDTAITILSVSATPPARCFKRGVPDKNLADAIRALFSIRDAPANRPDLQNWIPDKEDASDLLHYLNHCVAELKKRPAIQTLIAENGLTDDEIKILHSYKIQSPYPVYLWLNGWLGGDRRDDFVKEHVAPFFSLLYRAMEKLPRVKTAANRAIKVNGIPALKSTYDNHHTACAPKSTLSFWGFSSFSTADDVVNREEFVGKPQEEAIVYSCGELEGVDMEPFAPQGLKNESEILPLCPCVLEVVNHVKMGQKLIVGVKQLNHADFAYVAPK